MVQFEAFVDDLLLEEGVHHDGLDTCVFKLFSLLELF